MLKKLIVTGVVAAVAVAFLANTKIGRWAETKINHAIKQTEDKLFTLEDRLADLKVRVNHLDGDIEKAKVELATRMTDAGRLEKKVHTLDAEVTAATEQVRKKRDSLVEQEAKAKVLVTTDLDATQVNYDGKTMSLAVAKKKLDVEVSTVVFQKQELKSLRKQLEQEQSLMLRAENQFRSLKKQKEEASAKVAELELAIKDLRIAQIESREQKDNSRLSGIKKDADELERRIEIEINQLKLGGKSESYKSAEEIGSRLDDDR
jgi:chromosome segregation ATPase